VKEMFHSLVVIVGAGGGVGVEELLSLPQAVKATVVMVMQIKATAANMIFFIVVFNCL
jgi:hypothetical protein